MTIRGKLHTFRRGDIVCPLPKKVRSNDYGIKKLIKAKIIGVQDASHGSRYTQYITIEIIDGIISEWRRTYKKGDSLLCYNNAFQLFNNTYNYEIY